MSDLTIKQEKFAQKYVELGNASEAYRQSYNAEKSKMETVNREAHCLLENPKISARVEELKADHAKRHNVTVDSITAELEEARTLAMQEKQTASAVSASNSKAKLHGLLNDKVELDGDINITVTKKVVSARDSD